VTTIRFAILAALTVVAVAPARAGEPLPYYPTEALAFAEDGTLVALRRGVIERFDADGRELGRRTLAPDPAAVGSSGIAALSPDGTKVARSGSQPSAYRGSRDVYVEDAATGAPIRTVTVEGALFFDRLELDERGERLRVTFYAPRPRLLPSGERESSRPMRVFSVTTGLELPLTPEDDRSERARVVHSADRSVAAIITFGGVLLRDRHGRLGAIPSPAEFYEESDSHDTSGRVKGFGVKQTPVSALALSPRGKTVAIATRGVVVEDVRGASPAIRLERQARFLAFQDEAELVLVTDATIEIRDASTGATLRSFAHDGRGADGYALSPDRTRLAWFGGAGASRGARLLDLTTGRQLLRERRALFR
jgi:hypothetical protein